MCRLGNTVAKNKGNTVAKNKVLISSCREHTQRGFTNMFGFLYLIHFFLPFQPPPCTQVYPPRSQMSKLDCTHMCVHACYTCMPYMFEGTCSESSLCLLLLPRQNWNSRLNVDFGANTHA